MKINLYVRDFAWAHTAICDVDIALMDGRLALSRDEWSDFHRLLWVAAEEDYEPSREDVILLEDLLERIEPDWSHYDR